MNALHILFVTGLVVSAVFAAVREDLRLAAIALGVAGFFAALEFLLLHAPGIALAEAVLGAALVPLILLAAIRGIGKGEGK